MRAVGDENAAMQVSEPSSHAAASFRPGDVYSHRPSFVCTGHERPAAGARLWLRVHFHLRSRERACDAASGIPWFAWAPAFEAASQMSVRSNAYVIEIA